MDNQKLQNTANQRSEELKTTKQTTSSGETSSAKENVDGRGGTINRDVETSESSDRNSGSKVGDDRDSRNH